MHSSRLQSSKKVLVSSVIFFFLALGLTAYSAKNRTFASTGTAAASGLLRPFQSFHRFIRGGLLDIWDSYIALVNTESENRRLFSQTNLLRARNSKLLEIKHENDRLRDLLGLKESTGLAGVVADVIAYEPSNWSHAVTVDKGTSSQIRVGAPVLVGDGVVGQIVAANVNTARVLLLTDPSSAVDAFVQTSRVRGVVVGMGTFEARWNYVLSKESIVVGDRVVTSGMDEVFPKGLIIGVVKRVHEDRAGRLFKRVDIEPAVDFSRLETVLVVTGRSELPDDDGTTEAAVAETVEEKQSAAVQAPEQEQ